MAVVCYSTSSKDKDEVLRYLSTNTDFKELSCCDLQDHDVECLHNAMKLNRQLSLETLKLQNNGLTASSSPALANILRFAATLRELDLSDNAVKASGLAELVRVLTSGGNDDACRLQSLNLKNNKLGAHDGASQIGTLLRLNTSLQYLNIAKNNLGKKSSMKTIVHALCQNPHLRSLDLSHNQINDGTATVLASVLDPDKKVSVSRIQELDLTHNKIGPPGARNIVGAMLEGNRGLIKLNLSMNHLGPKGAENIGILLKYNHTLQELWLSRNDIGDAGITLICQGIEESKTVSGSALRRLSLDWNSIHNVQAMADLLRGNATLEYLNLASNAIQNEGAQALAHALSYDQTLQELDLVGNQIQDVGAVALADQLCRADCQLELLHWEKNSMTSNGEERIRQALQFRESRRTWLGQHLSDIEKHRRVELRLLHRDVTDVELAALIAHLAMYQSFVPAAYIGGKGITSRSIKVLAKDVLSNNAATVRRLYLKDAPIGDFGCGAIAQSLLSNYTLRVLCLSGCRITAEGAKIISNALRRNHKLERLDLSKNAIGTRGLDDILASLQDPKPHPSLISLNVACNNIEDGALVALATFAPLEEVNLSGNALTDGGALDIAKACLGPTPTLRWLDVTNNRGITYKGVQTIALFLPAIAQLDADGNDESN